MKDVTGAHSLLVEGSTEEDGRICLEPYTGFKYPQHDYKRLFVIRAKAQAAQDSEDPLNTSVYDRFTRHFKHQLDYFARHYSKELYGTAELEIKFGRSYVVNPPPDFVEDQSQLVVDDLMKALERRKTRTIDPMFSGGSFRQRGNRGQVRSSESSITTSFVSSVRLDDDATEFLRSQLGTRAHEQEEGVKVVAQTGSAVCTARYNKDLEFIGIETSPIRWIVSDIKRLCRVKGDDAEGCECDVRLMLKTQVTAPITDAVAFPTLLCIASDLRDALGG